MTTSVKNKINLLRNMGFRYVRFRTAYEVMRRTGLLTKKFPASPAFQVFMTLQTWKSTPVKFFFDNKDDLRLTRNPSGELKNFFEDYRHGKLKFFGSTLFDLGQNYDWVTNPETGFKYDVAQHWTKIPDYSKDAGDIKYVWEKSRFSFLYDIIRYDYHFGKDCAALVFSEIISWIESNPINCGPNYRCSQEISLRVLNWTFALYYYKDSSFLTEEVFNKIQFAIFWQIHHVYENINFSRIAVRNNHAITETLALYLTGLLYPKFPNAEKWKKKGKAWFGEEIAYQIYEDGTFLQFSMNYHRVVVQLLTWAVALAEKNGETFAPVVYERAKKSVEFLRTCMIDDNGRLPNYGANDGALFFKLNDQEFGDYRPQLNALAYSLKADLQFPEQYEDVCWYGLESSPLKIWNPKEGIHEFVKGGYYVIREADTLTFIRCGNHKDRPSQADNLHLDVWYKGQNILQDGGSYQYNADGDTLKYFMGTASHNTVMLGNYDQMKKGDRFIWYHWTQCSSAELNETEDTFYFKGTISAFGHVANGIAHTREIIKTKGKPGWIIKDSVSNKPSIVFMKQLWHLPLRHLQVAWKSTDKNGRQMIAKDQEGFVSELYGKKEGCEMIIFQSEMDEIITVFEIKV